MMRIVPAPGVRSLGSAGVIATVSVIAMLFAMPHRAGASGSPAAGVDPVASAADTHARNALFGEFNAICFDLTLARAALARGAMGDDQFADRILALFVRADSLATLLRADAARARGDMGAFALQRGVTYLIDSLRENYVGIVGRNGVSFLEADQALQAAVAWRSDAATASPAR